MKRYYFRNRDVEVDGRCLSITAGGTVYLNDAGIQVKLDSLWLERLRQMCVSLPDGSMVRLKTRRDGVAVVKRGLGIYA